MTTLHQQQQLINLGKILAEKEKNEDEQEIFIETFENNFIEKLQDELLPDILDVIKKLKVQNL